MTQAAYQLAQRPLRAGAAELLAVTRAASAAHATHARLLCMYFSLCVRDLFAAGRNLPRLAKA